MMRELHRTPRFVLLLLGALAVASLLSLLIPPGQTLWSKKLGISGTVETGTFGCGDASLEFVPDDLEIEGSGPFEGALTLRDSGEQGLAQNVEVTLSLDKNGEDVCSVVFSDGDAWSVTGPTDTHVHAVGDIAAGGEVVIGFTVGMMPSWDSEEDGTEAKIRWTVTREDCRPDQNADGYVRATVTILKEALLEESGSTPVAEPTAAPTLPPPTATVEPTATPGTPLIATPTPEG